MDKVINGDRERSVALEPRSLYIKYTKTKTRELENKTNMTAKAAGLRPVFLLLFLVTPSAAAWMQQWSTTKQFGMSRSKPSPPHDSHFTQRPNPRILRRPQHSVQTMLFSNSGEDKENEDDESSNSSSPTTSILERLQMAGVSVSPKGFHVILKKATSAAASNDPSTPILKYLALKVTNDPADAFAATSPESLTLCQLLGGVDMAGAILPPELLSKLVVYHIEEKRQKNQQLQEQEQTILNAIQESLSQTSQDSYKDAHVWFQNRIKLPQITLDQLTLVPSLSKNQRKVEWNCRLECALPEWKERIVLPKVKPEILESLAFQYDPDSSLLFTCIALALRYKAPIVLEQTNLEANDDPATTLSDRFTLTLQNLEKAFPQRTTVGKLQQQSTRVAENIERGFEIHKLQGALTIAMKLGDKEAAKRIRAKLDEYDSMQDLPTTSPAATTIVKDDENDDGSLDDLDKNILQ
jgi:CRISPR/Cas system-associated endoribonuclease Cas2